MKFKLDSYALEYDDILLVPTISDVDHRGDVDLSFSTLLLKLEIPIIASPMKGIVGTNMINEISRLGGIGILPRFYPNDEYETKLHEIKNSKNFGAAIGLNDNQKLMMALDAGAKIVCIDVANGYTNDVYNYVEYVSNFIGKQLYDCHVMAGNVVTAEGCNRLTDAGAAIIRVGIGSGALCTTRTVTGVGIPQVSALDNCDNSYAEWIVADGGIKSSGDALKALAVGADLVMLGSLLAQCYESEHNGIISGMASRALQDEYYHSVKSVEGISKEAKQTRSLEDFISEFVWGMKSGMTYLNAKNLQKLGIGTEFVLV